MAALARGRAMSLHPVHGHRDFRAAVARAHAARTLPSALLLHGLGLQPDLFSPTFAIGRAPGWIAHCFEQQQQGRLIRPSSEYIGERGRSWTPLAGRSS